MYAMPLRFNRFQLGLFLFFMKTSRKERKAIQKGPCNALLVRCNAVSCLAPSKTSAIPHVYQHICYTTNALVLVFQWVPNYTTTLLNQWAN